MNDFKDAAKAVITKNRFIAANVILICLLTSTVGLAFQQVIAVFSDDWHGAYYPFMAFVIALLSLLSRRANRHLPPFSGERIIRIIFEWVLILLSLKILVYLLNDPSRFLTDVWLWDDNFFKYFFPPDYIVAVVGALLFSLIASWLGEPIDQLEEDKELMDQEKLGFTVNDRTKARKQLIALIFGLGSLQLFITTLLISDIPSLPIKDFSETRLITALVLYFVLGFLLIALNQYNLQKARWYLSDYLVSPAIGQRWLIFCILLVVLISLLAIFLPTNYILGIFPAIKYLFNLLVYVYNFLVSLIFLPFLALIKLFGNSPSETPQLPESTQESPTPPQPLAPDLMPTSMPILDVIKSLLFWSVFILLIFFALRYYFRQRGELLGFLKKVTIAKWLTQFWQWVKRGFRKVTDFTTRTVKNGISALNERFSRKKPGLTLTDVVRSLSPRAGVIMSYRKFREWLGINKIPVKEAQTPAEVARQIISTYEIPAVMVDPICELFCEARYTKHKISRTHYQQINNFIEQLKLKLIEGDQAK